MIDTWLRRYNRIRPHEALGIRAWREERAGLVTEPLFTNPMIVAASPTCPDRHGTPEHPDDLRQHQCLAFSRLDEGITWRSERGQEAVRVPIRGRFRCDQGDSLVAMAAPGFGIIVMPRWVMTPELAAGTLARVLPDWTAMPLPLQAVYPRAHGPAQNPPLSRHPARAGCLWHVGARKLMPGVQKRAP